MNIRAIWHTLLFIIMTSAVSARGEISKQHPYSVHDTVAFEKISSPKPSPDGKWVVYSKKTWDPKSNKSTSGLWLVSTDGKTTRALPSVKNKADSSPVWSPDGRTIAFLSNRSDSQQIWMIRVAGGQPKKLTNFAVDVDALSWSPDGSHLSFAAGVYVDAADLRETATRDKAKADNPVKAIKYDKLMIRHWDTWLDGKRNHIFVLPIKKSGEDWRIAGKEIDLMKGIDGDSPTKPFGGNEDYAWSSDGKEIAYVVQLGRDMAWSTDLNVFVVPATGGVAKSITTENKAMDKNPVYSPDGNTIAYLAMEKQGFESDRFRIKLFDRKTGTARTLTESWDRSPDSIAWALDGKSLYVTAEESARKKVFKVDLSSGQPKEIVGEHTNGDLSLFSNKSMAKEGLVFAQNSWMGPNEIWTAANDGTQRNRLTHVNDERLKSAQMSTAEEFYFVGALNEKVQGWIFKPVGFDETKKYPVAFLIHGGPQGAWGDSFSSRWNPQTFAGAGYAVVMINFHGSTGFGQAFTDSISGDWGGKPYDDLMIGLDYALANHKWLDAERVGALGASYGGFMINWINGHTDRFKCLVNHDGILDSRSMYFTTEELWFMEWENKGVPWENAELYEKFNPVHFVGKWKTPTLVIQGGKDFRVPDGQGIGTFTALQRRGIPSQLLYFPDENHWVLKPKNSILWHETVLAWLEQWLKK